MARLERMRFARRIFFPSDILRGFEGFFDESLRGKLLYFVHFNPSVLEAGCEAELIMSETNLKGPLHPNSSIVVNMY